MAHLTTQEIKNLAKEVIKNSPGGIRYSQLVKRIQAGNEDTPTNTINGSIWNLDVQFPNEVSKPSRGLFTWSTDANSDREPVKAVERNRVRESEFYASFAEWLKNDLDEVTVAEELGGAGLQRKWGTPDVVGIYKPLASNLIKFPLEIISAEIKVDAGESVVAFGQAVSYRLFSSKSYIVMPVTITEEDLSRLEALCMVHGIGLVLFELNAESPNYEIRVRAQRVSPDMFYVNEFAERLRQHNSEKFERLFS